MPKSLAQISYEANGSLFGTWPGRYECVWKAHETSTKFVLWSALRRLRRAGLLTGTPAEIKLALGGKPCRT